MGVNVTVATVEKLSVVDVFDTGWRFLSVSKSAAEITTVWG